MLGSQPHSFEMRSSLAHLELLELRLFLLPQIEQPQSLQGRLQTETHLTSRQFAASSSLDQHQFRTLMGQPLFHQCFAHKGRMADLRTISSNSSFPLDLGLSA